MRQTQAQRDHTARLPTILEELQSQQHDIPDSESESLKSIPTKDTRTWKRHITDNPHEDKKVSIFRHQFWYLRRETTDAALNDAGTDPRQLDRFRACGQNAFVFKSDTDHDKFRVQCDRCKSRWCEACQNERRLIIRRNLTEKLPEGRLRFMTLTVKSGTDLTERTAHLHACFLKLRRSPYYKEKMHGGIWFLEITRRKDNNEWHPHYHIIYTGDYIAKEKLSLDWHKTTKDSFIVDIREMKDRKTAPHYVTKYASKAIAPEIWKDHDSLIELMQAYKNQKLLGTFGTWRGLKLCETPKSEEGWTLVGPLWKITLAAAAGDAEAKNLLSRLGKYNPHDDDHGNEEFDNVDTG